MGKVIKWLLIIVVVIISALLLAAFLIPKIIDEKTLRDAAQDAAREATGGGELRIAGPLGLSILPTASIDLADVSLVMPKETEPMFSARKAAIAVNVLPLLTGEVKVKGIELDGLNLVLKSGTEAKPTVSTDGMSDKQLEAFYARQKQARDKAAKDAAQQVGQAAALPVMLNAGKLALTDSTVTYIDEIAKSETVIYVDEFRASNLNAQGDAFPLKLVMAINPKDAAQAVNLQVKGDLALDAGTRVLKMQGMRVEATPPGMAAIKLALSGEADLIQTIANLSLKLDSDGANGDGTVRYAANESPQINANLHLSELNPALLLLAGPDAADAANDSAAKGAGSDALPLDLIRSLDNRVNLTIDKATFDTVVIEQLKLQARAKEGVVNINQLSGKVYGGQLNAKAVFNGRYNTAKLSAQGKLTDLDLAQAVAAQSMDLKVTGKAGLDFDITSSGKTATDLRTRLNGPVSLQAPGVAVQDVAAEKMFCQAVALINREAMTAEFPDNTTFNTVSVKLQFANGKAQLQPLTIATDNISMNGTGNLYLADLQFRADLRAVLSTALKEKDNACRINKRMENIQWPVRCKGDLSGDPAKWCGIDSGDILEQMATQEAKKKLEEEGGKLLKKLFGDD